MPQRGPLRQPVNGAPRPTARSPGRGLARLCRRGVKWISWWTDRHHRTAIRHDQQASVAGAAFLVSSFQSPIPEHQARGNQERWRCLRRGTRQWSKRRVGDDPRFAGNAGYGPPRSNT
jgi:hypothetical protein